MRGKRGAGYCIPLCVWTSVAAAVVLVQHLSAHVLPDPQHHWTRQGGLRTFIDGFAQYDSFRYLDIAQHGYEYHRGVQSTIVWFPLYPLAIRALSHLVEPPLTAAVLVTLVASGVAFQLYWRWLASKGIDGRSRVACFLALAVYPYSWYLYGVVYADALFLVFVLAAFVLVEGDHLVLGGIAGALATATRPTGMVLVPVLVALAATNRGVLVPRGPRAGRQARSTGVRGWPHRFVDWIELPTGVQRDRVRWSTFAPGLSALGVGTYATYLWVRFGDPLIFITNEATFHGGRYPLLKGTFLNRLVHFPDVPVYTLTITLQALFILAALVSVGAVARRFGFAYGLLVLLTVTFAWLGSHDFQGTGRYLLGCFPLFALAGERLMVKPRIASAVLAVSATLMLVMTFGFARTTYLA